MLRRIRLAIAQRLAPEAFEALRLHRWLDSHPMPDTAWAGADTLEMAEHVHSAGERLNEIEASLPA
jgi:hypothetical protein